MRMEAYLDIIEMVRDALPGPAAVALEVGSTRRTRAAIAASVSICHQLIYRTVTPHIGAGCGCSARES